MEAYRDRYAEIRQQRGTVIAVSTDDADTMKRWRDELKAPYNFVADPERKLLTAFDTKMPVLPLASRRTFVIGKGRTVLEVQEGGDAIDPSRAVRACGLRRPEVPGLPRKDAGG